MPKITFSKKDEGAKPKNEAYHIMSVFTLKGIDEADANGIVDDFDNHFMMGEVQSDWSNNTMGNDLEIYVYDERVKPSDLRWLLRKFGSVLKNFTINTEISNG